MPAAFSPPLRRDPQLPHRDRVLKEDLVGEWLSTHLSAEGRVRLDSIERGRVKYRIGESLRVVYRIRAGASESTIAARVFRPGRSATAFRDANRAAAAVGRFRGVSHAPELDTVFWTFPNDRRIADLTLLCSPQPRLADALGLARVRTRVVAYAPEKSATAACLDDSGAVVAYAKAYAGDEARRVSGIYREIDRVLPEVEAHVRVPRLLGHPGAPNALILEAIDGVPLCDLPARDRTTGVERLGTALSAMHTLPAPAAPSTRLSPGRLSRAAELIARVRPDVERLARDLHQELARRRVPDRERLVRLHGDVHPKNAILANGHVALVDLDQSAAGTAAMDLGSFLAHLRCERTLGNLAPAAERRLASAFLAGYAAQGELPPPDSLRWHTAAALLVERAFRAVNRVRPDGLAHLAALLAAAADVVTRERDA